MADGQYDIQKLVNETGIPRRTIYFYVQQGILPPPQGAGLAATYSEDHLLRLRLIPILRQQGLRLDDIRERFAEMSLEEMRQAASQGVPRGAPAQPSPRHQVQEIPWPAPGWGAQRYLHYSLPLGITLSVPENLGPTDRQRLNLLLQAARQIFSGATPQYVFQANDAPGSNTGDPRSHQS